MAMTENDKIAKYGPIVRYVQSMDDKRQNKPPYEVRCKDNIYACSCKGFVFSKEIPKSCKHIKAHFEHALTKTSNLEITIAQSMLAAAGVVGLLKERLTSHDYSRKVEMMAAHLKPHLGKGGEMATAASASCGDEDLRVLVLDD